MAAVPGIDHDDLLLVRRDGEIKCLDGEELTAKWTSPPSALSRLASVPNVTDFNVEFAQVTDAYSASKGLLRGREDTFAVFPLAIDREKFNPTILVVITSPSDEALSSVRTLHVLALPQGTDFSSRRNSHVHTLVTLQIPWSHKESAHVIGDLEYSLQVSSDVLYELAGGFLTIFDITRSVAQVKSRLPIQANTFIPLSRTSIVASSNESMSVYHPIFRSIQASIDLKSALDPETMSKKRKLDHSDETMLSKPFRLVGHSTKQGVVLAISGAELLSFQIDARRDDYGRPRALGLLIDSIGCGISNIVTNKPRELQPLDMNALGEYVIGSAQDSNITEIIDELDNRSASQDIEAFEEKMAGLVGLWGAHKALGYGGIVIKGKKAENNNAEPNSSPWMWPKQRSEYPPYDPVWAQYAIRKIFSWSNDRPTEEMQESITSGEDRLHIVFFPPNVLYWLIQTGNLNKVSIASALQGELQASSAVEIPSGQIVKSLVEIDPEMNLLLSLLSSTYLEAPELLHAIRTIMDSLGIFGDAQEKQLALTNGERPSLVNGDLDAAIAFEEDQADLDLQLAEYRLGDGSSVRHQALSVALAKLYTCPSTAIVRGLQSIMTLSEIVSLIYLLRFELAGGSWTSRYLDFYQGSSDDSGPPDSAIILISTLLSRCIDAVGAGGWLSGDAMLVNGDHFESEELITSLKLEVSAALEGVEEASYLQGLTAEMVRFAESMQKSTAAASKKTKAGDVKPVVLKLGESDGVGSMLPFGLKAEQQVSLQKVGAGGELYTRSMRDIGRLKSRKVGKYSREKIVV